MNKDKLISAGQSYLRAFIAAGLALYLAGVTDWKAILTAGATAVAGPLLKALDPKSTDFGVGSK